MSDNDQQGQDDQLFDTDDSDSDADVESTSSDEQDSDSAAEEIEELDLSDEDKTKEKSLSKSDLERKKQIDTWSNRVSSGEVNLKDLPANLKWLKPHILERLDATTQAPSAEEVVKKVLAEERDNVKFDTLRGILNKTRLSTTQRKELETEYKDLRARGLPKSVSLDKAMRIIGVQEDTEVASAQLKQDMAVSRPGGKVRNVKGEDMLSDPAIYSRLPEQDRLAKLEEMRKSRFRS